MISVLLYYKLWLVSSYLIALSISLKIYTIKTSGLCFEIHVSLPPLSLATPLPFLGLRWQIVFSVLSLRQSIHHPYMLDEYSSKLCMLVYYRMKILHISMEVWLDSFLRGSFFFLEEGRGVETLVFVWRNTFNICLQFGTYYM